MRVEKRGNGNVYIWVGGSHATRQLFQTLTADFDTISYLINADFNYDIATTRAAVLLETYWSLFTPNVIDDALHHRSTRRDLPVIFDIAVRRLLFRVVWYVGLSLDISLVSNVVDQVTRHRKTSTASPPRMIPHLYHQITACESVMCDFSEKR